VPSQQQQQQPARQAPAPSQPPSQQYANLVKPSQIPSLSPFPEFAFDLGKITTNFDLSVRPRQPPPERPLRRLTFKATDELKQLRQNLERDFADFSNRMKKLGSNEPLNLEALTFPSSRATPAPQPEDAPKKGRKTKESLRKPPEKQTKPRVEPKPRDPPPEEDEAPSFTVASTFLLPDGSQYGT
jgi:hypothetical protein